MWKNHLSQKDKPIGSGCKMESIPADRALKFIKYRVVII